MFSLLRRPQASTSTPSASPNKHTAPPPPPPPQLIEPPPPSSARREKESKWLASISKRTQGKERGIGLVVPPSPGTNSSPSRKGKERAWDLGEDAGVAGLGEEKGKKGTPSVRSRRSGIFRNGAGGGGGGGGGPRKGRDREKSSPPSLSSPPTLSPLPAAPPPLAPNPRQTETANLAQRLQELAVAHADGLLDEEEYRVLRGEVFASSLTAGTAGKIVNGPGESAPAVLGMGGLEVPRLDASGMVVSRPHYSSPPLSTISSSPPVTAPAPASPPTKAASILSSQSRRTSVLNLGGLFRKPTATSIRSGVIVEPTSPTRPAQEDATGTGGSVYSGRSSHANRHKNCSEPLPSSSSRPLAASNYSVRTRSIRNHPGLSSSALDIRSQRFVGGSSLSAGGESVFSASTEGSRRYGGANPSGHRSPLSLSPTKIRNAGQSTSAPPTAFSSHSSSRGSSSARLETLSSFSLSPSSSHTHALPPIPSSSDPAVLAATSKEPGVRELREEIREIEREWESVREVWSGVVRGKWEGWKKVVGEDVARLVKSEGSGGGEEKRSVGAEASPVNAAGLGGGKEKKGLFRRPSFTVRSSSPLPTVSPPPSSSSPSADTLRSLPLFLRDPPSLPSALSAALPEELLQVTKELIREVEGVWEKKRETDRKYETRVALNPTSASTRKVGQGMAPAPRGTAAAFACTEPGCDKSFSRKEYLARHHRSKHSKERPFQCEYCERGFSRSDLLKRHYLTCAEAKAQKEAREGSGDSPKVSSPRASPSATVASAEPSPEPELPVPPIPLTTSPAASAAASTSAAYSAVPVPPPINHAPGFPPPPFPQLNQQPPPLLNASEPPFSYFPIAFPGVPNVPNQMLREAVIARDGPNAVHNPSDGSGSSNSSSQAMYTGSPANLVGSQASNGSFSRHADTSPELPPPEDGRQYQHSQQPPPPHSQHFLPISQSLLQPPAFPSMQHPQPSLPPPLPSLAPSESSQPSTSGSVFNPSAPSTATLAPGLSGSTGNFTQDEVLASEVLRDLMRSPFGGFPPRVSQAIERWPGSQMEGQVGGANGQVVPGGQNATWLAAGGEAGNVGGYFDPSTAVVSGGGGNGTLTPTSAYLAALSSAGPTSSEVNNDLENTPAARQLAEYFNKGGVGGITALDLGFPTEPNIWPEWIYTPQVPHDADDSRFFLPEQKFYLGYLYPWHVPPLPVLSAYARKATNTLLPSIPVIHAPSVNVSTMALHTAFALTVAGGAYEEEGQSFANEMLVEKRVFLIRGFQAPEKTFEDRFASLQSLLLYQLLGLFHRDEQQRLLSQSFHSALVYMLRSLDLPKQIRETPVPPLSRDWTVGERETNWKNWVEVETWRRVTFIVFLTDLEHSIATSSAQHLSLSDMNLDLPASESLWSSSTSAEWQERAISASALAPTPISFLTAIRALMAREAPDPFSAQGLLLTELGRLSSFPLLILSRTLSFLERKTEEALAQIDPLKGLLGGLGVVEDREQENRDVLHRIRRGREVLRKLPGGVKRGGGEGWFQDVMPTASSFVPSPSSNSSRSFSTCTSSNSPPTPLVPTPPPLPSATLEPTLEQLLAEFDPAPYQPYYSAGGAAPNESYESAQERMRKLAEKRRREVEREWPEAFGLGAGLGM
ncbi:hypothetical protein JCM11641_002611 [Rhodosporidiobolus odoratus]